MSCYVNKNTIKQPTVVISLISFWRTMTTLILLLLAHALADFPLQGEFLSRLKSKHSGINIPWQWGMLYHCLIHAGLVWLITDSWIFFIFEFVAHWVIDYLKCDNKISFTVDQGLHIWCKILYTQWYWVLLFF